MSELPRYCRTCGRRLDRRRIEGRIRAFCPNCTEPRYRNPKPAAGVLVVDTDAVLLVERTVPPAVGSWSVPAGFLEADERPETAAVRELAEETTIQVDEEKLSLLETNFVTHPDRTSVLVIVYVVPRSDAIGTPEPGSDAAAARFWSLPELDRSDETVEPGYRELLATAIERHG